MASDGSGSHEHMHYQEYTPPGWPTGKREPFEKERAHTERNKLIRDYMNLPAEHERSGEKVIQSSPVVEMKNGSALDFRSLTPQQIRQNTEMLTPLIRPYGCGPVAPADWLVLRTYQRIVEMRDEMRMDEQGLCIGDRTFKRRYQQAETDIRRYNKQPPETRSEAARKGDSGVEQSRSGPEKTGPHPRIRSPTYAVRSAFRYLTDKHWHRYMLPFGCFFYDRVNTTANDSSWNGWIESLVPCKANPSLRINPYSVTAADILYLCNTTGYLERFMFVIGVILWAKQRG